MTAKHESQGPGASALVGLGLIVAMGAAVASCLIAGYDKAEDGGGGAGGGTSSASMASADATASGSAGGDELPTCETTEFPEGPTGAPSNGGVDQWFALRTITLGDPSVPTKVPGFDLDRVESCNDDCKGDVECARPDFLSGLTSREEQKRCDWPKAVDNTAAYLFQSAGLGFGATDKLLTDGAEDGTWSLLIRIQEWNGTVNDAEVTVSVYSSSGWEASVGGTTSSSGATVSSAAAGSSGAGSGGGGGMGEPEPAWDGTDIWSIDPRSLSVPSDPNTPIHRTELAYVAGGMLVAQVDGLFFAGSRRFPIQLVSGRLLAPLVLAPGVPPKIEGATFAGRWRIADVLDAVGSLGSVADQGGLPCIEDTDTFKNVAGAACLLVDVTVPAGPGTCNALSFGIGFDAEAAGPGGIVALPTPGECPVVTCDTLLAEEN